IALASCVPLSVTYRDGGGGDLGGDAMMVGDVADTGDIGDIVAPVDGGCPSPLMLCGAVCADMSMDPNNCGTCGHACPGGMACGGGQCMGACPTGQQFNPSM